MVAGTITIFKEKIEAFCRATEVAFECVIHIDYGSSYYQVKNDEVLADAFLAFAEQDSTTNAILCDAAMTGEDFGYFLQEIPGLLFWAGVNSDYGLHHPKLSPDEAVIDYLVPFIDAYFREISG